MIVSSFIQVASFLAYHSQFLLIMKHTYYRIPFFTLFFLALLLPLTVHGQLFEDFESGTKAGYASGSVELSSGSWFFHEALLGTDDRDRKIGSRSVRLRHDRPEPYVAMEFDIDGAGDVRFYHANSNFSGDGGGKIQLQYSTNAGGAWSDIGPEIVSPQSELELAIIPVNISGDVRFRIIKTAGGRVNIDNFEITAFEEISEDPRLRAEVGGSLIENGGTVAFGSVMTGNEVTRTLTLTNTGQDTLVFSDAAVSGSEAFSLQGETGGELAYGENVQMILSFTPETLGDYEGVFSVGTNDPERQTFTLNLTGRGLPSDEPISIAEARGLPLGTVVTVAGWVTVADELSGPIYFQDETAGIASYYAPLMRDEEVGFTLEAAHGDSIVVTGPLTTFNDLLQIAPVEGVMNTVEFEVFPEANREITPRIVTIADLNTGSYEGQLVQLDSVLIEGTGSFSGQTNYDFTDGVSTSEIRISEFTDLPGVAIPNVPVNIVGAASRFRQYVQVFPRSRADIIQIGDAPLFLSAAPFETAATPGSITFQWATDRPGTTELCYGLTAALELGCVEDAEPKEEHQLVLEGLDAGTIYKVQLRSAAGTDTSRTNPYFVTTTSPPEATQEINVYFNKSVDHTLAVGKQATENFSFPDHYIRRIFEAQHSIDIAFYSTSGSVGTQIANFLGQAHNRGVEVRVILDHTTSTSAVETELQANGVPFILSNFGSRNSGRSGIHHNKFAVIDYKGGNPDDVWLITSSWNATDQGSEQQYQNMIEFQDVAIAGAYTREFDQMWGSTTTTPSSANARFGENKQVVNPMLFWIGDSHVRLHFSPQGGTEDAIVQAISRAEHSVNVGTMLITRFTIANAMRERHDAGLTVRGVIGNVGVTGSQFDNISSWGDFIHFPEGQFGLLHHKYAIIDGEQTSWNGTVITGSHNWSGAANQVNDENTIIITDSRIANQYIQEFGARYKQVGGENEIVVSSETDHTELPQRFTVHQNYPNPFNPSTVVSFELPSDQIVNIRLFDTLGREVATLVSGESLSAGRHEVTFDASTLSSGIYIYRVELGNGQSITRKMTLIK
jgi:phosphatidylserine/phosphatidylglycerophosphate/cardiolipin synthase-like enzyme